MPIEEVFTADDLLTIETDLMAALASQGFAVGSLKLIGIKGSGSHSTVFSVLLDDTYHILKVYREAGGFKREIKHLRQQVPLDRLFFVWPATLHRYRYNIVIIEMPEGQELHASTLNDKTIDLLARGFINLHSIRYRERVSTRAIDIRLRGQITSIMAHAADFRSLDGADIETTIDAALKYLRRHAKSFRVAKSRDHGDPWWGNVIVAEEDVYLVDWEGVKRDDYCEDLAKFRVLMDYERDSEPYSFWDTPIDHNLVNAAADRLLTHYEAAFPDDANIRGRFGFYCLYFAGIVFGDYYFHDKRGSIEAKTILRTGIEMFERYC